MAGFPNPGSPGGSYTYDSPNWGPDQVATAAPTTRPASVTVTTTQTTGTTARRLATCSGTQLCTASLARRPVVTGIRYM